MLENTNRIGLSVQKVPFKMNGIVYITCQFYDVMGNVFKLANEPCLVSEAIDTNIFGMHTEQRFKSIKRDHEDGIMTFSAYNGDEIKINFFREKQSLNSNLAYVRVMKATIVEPSSYSFIKSKVVNPSKNKGEVMLFNGANDINYSIPDLLVNNLASRNILIPVINKTDENITIKRGTYLGDMCEVEESPIVGNEIAGIKLEDVSKQIGNIGDENIAVLNRIMSDYKTAVKTKKKVIPIEHTIDLKDEIPVSQQPRRIPQGLQEPIKEHLEKLLKNGHVVPSNSSYGSPIIPIIKRNGDVRIAIDYRALNKKTIPRRYPIPHQDDLIQKVKGSSIFTVLDLKQGYYNIPVRKSDQEKTAFIVPWGKFEWPYMPLGLVGAPFTFGEVMAFIFKDFDFVVCFYDDMLIFSKNISEHFVHFRKVLDRLAEYGFEVNDIKSQLFMEEFLFLGFKVSAKGIQIDVKKMNDIVNFSTPENADDLRKFLGTTGFLRRFLKNFAIEAAPLYDLLKERSSFNWTPECNTQFLKIKKLVKEADILSHPDYNEPFILCVDASDKGIGFYLGQAINGRLNFITFGGRTLTDTERRYAILDKELLEIYYAVKCCYVFLCQHDYIVYSDHKPLTENYYLRDIYGRRYRWLNYLEENNARVVYIKGKENIMADFVSRNVKSTPNYRMTNISAIEFYSLLNKDEDLWTEQNHDDEIAKLSVYLDNPTSENLALVDKKYKKQLSNISRRSDGVIVISVKGELKIIPPAKYKKEILELCHNNFLSGHQGIFKTHQRVLCRFWWPELFIDIKNWIKRCNVCQITKTVHKKAGVMVMRKWPKKPLEFISKHFLVDLPKTNRGHLHILVINDHFSKFIRLYPLKDRQAKTAAKCVADYCLDLGIPEKLLSDQDPAYESNLFKELMRILGIKKNSY